MAKVERVTPKPRKPASKAQLGEWVDGKTSKRHDDKPAKRKVTIYLPVDTARRLKVTAASEDTTISALVEEALATRLAS